MLALSIDGNQFDRDVPKTITLSLLTLRSELGITNGHPFYNTARWQRVIFNYESTAFRDQTKAIIFRLDGSTANPSIVDRLGSNFISDLKIKSITISDVEGGYLRFRRGDSAVDAYDVTSDAEEQPEEVIVSSSGLDRLIIPSSVLSRWEVGYKARIYDQESASYLNPVLTVSSIDEQTDEAIFDQSLTVVINNLVLQSQNGNKYNVTVSDSGVLTTELDGQATPTERFNIKQLLTDDLYQLVVDNDGVLGISLSEGEDLNLPIKNHYFMESIGSVRWFPSINDDGFLQMIQFDNNLEGFELRFAFKGEVSLDQLKRFKFQ